MVKLAPLAAVLLLAGCGGGARPQPRLLVSHAADPVALTPLPDGGFLYAERTTGRVRRVTAAGALIGAPLARVMVRTDGQRGLLGLTTIGRAIYGAWSARDGRLLVAQLTPRRRLVWTGPQTNTLANGGHLATLPDSRIAIGVGDLQGGADPNARSILTLDPNGPPSQTPRVLSRGWNNPFAFAADPSGAIWVADNSPGRAAERLGRGDRDNAPRMALARKTAPSALALGRSEIVICGFVSGRLDRDTIDGDTAKASGDLLATDCATGVARLRNGALVYAAIHGDIVEVRE